MSARPRSLVSSLIFAPTLGAFGAVGGNAIAPVEATPKIQVSQKQRRGKGKKTKTRVWWRSGSRYKPHQGERERARRRGDWHTVSLIDSAKRFPFGINHRLKHLFTP